MKNYIFKKVNENPGLDSEIWKDVEKAVLTNESNFCEKDVQLPNVTAQGVCSVYGITVKFESDEKNPVTRYSEPNQPAWLDSCVEFFFSPCENDNKQYLNFEQSLGGALLLQIGSGAEDRKYIPHDDKTFATERRIDENGWAIKFYIPFSFLDKYFYTTKKNIKGNFQFCCEDKGIYLTWNKIENPTPAFHKPEYFGDMTFDLSILDRMEIECKKYGYNVFDICEMTDKGIESRHLLPSDITHYSFSITKCVTSILFGMLRDQGLVNENDKVADYLSEYFPKDVDPKWYEVKLCDVLHHRDGGSGGGIWNKELEKFGENDKDLLYYIFQDKLPYEIGKDIVYCESNYYIISRIIEKVTGMKMDEWALKNLFNPLGFERFSWSRCPQNHTFGGTGLSMRTCDMVKLGWIYANNGMYNGKRFLSEDWIKKALDVIKVDEFGDYGFAVQHTSYMNDIEYYLVGSGDQTVIFTLGKPSVLAFHAEGAGGHLGLLKAIVEMRRTEY